MTRQPNCCRAAGQCRRRAAPFSIAVVVTLGFAAATAAREEGEAFVAGLRERGQHELALEYLDRIRTSRLADDEFRRRIPYHRGILLIDQARLAPDRDRRAALFRQARTELDAFIADNPESAAGAEALVELANALVDQGKQLAAEAAQLPPGAAYAGKRGELLGSARRLFDDAIPRFQRAERFYREALDQLPKQLDPKTQSDEIQLRQDYRGRLAQASVLAAQAEFEKAGTFEADSDEARKLYQRTANSLATLHDEYSRWLVGLYARLYEGRCYQALGDYQAALGCYDQLISQPSVHPAFRKLIAAAYGWQAACLLAQGNFDAAIESCTRWLGDARDGEASEPEWLMVRFELAKAKREKAASRDTPPSQKRRLLAEARDAYRFVANSPGEFQGAARAAAASLGPDDPDPHAEPRTFREAYDAGKEAMAAVNAAKLALPSAEKNNPSAVPELKLQMDEGLDNARRSFRIALTLVDDDTRLDELNEVRYFLCWLSWENGDYYESAVLGEFLARRYSDHPAAAAAAKVALASYDRLQQSAGARPAEAGFEARKMAEIADFIARRWPDTPAAETALRVQAAYAIQHGRVEEAKKLLADVAPAARPALEAQLGAAIWARYLELSQRPGASRPDQHELQRLRAEAVSLLERGYDAARKSGQLSESAATAALYLVQAALSQGNDAEAIRRLEEPEFGPLALIQKNNPAAARPQYQVEVYKAALRAYVSATPPRAEKAVTMMRRLEEATAATGGSEDQLTRVYLSLAVALDQQIEELRDAGRDADARRVSAAFAEFLREISARQESANWATRSWIAHTYFTMGEQQRAPRSAASPAPESAQQYFASARDAYLALLADAEKDPAFAPSPAAVLAARKQLGDCYRELGEYKKALDTFSQVLAEEEAQLSVQQAAAQTYQARGMAGDAKWLERAIYGGYQLRSTGKNRIWGWLKLAQVAERAGRSNPAYMDVFYEARLEAARCRYLVGLKTQGADRQRHLATAMQSIRSMLTLYPEMGGPQWRGQFDGLAKQIQEALGEQPVGLKELAAVP